MGNLGTSIKKFLQNKNTVTVLGVVLAIVILYVAYNMRVKAAINPINVPYATQLIAPLSGDVIRNQGDVIDKYSNEDTLIPEGSLFYTRQVVEKEQLNANIILEYPKGYVLYNLSVDSKSTYGNSVYPGNYIDIYLKAVNKIDEDKITAENRSEADKIMLGKLLANIKVLAVKDSTGAAVFSNIDEKRAPAMVVFALPEEYYLILKKAEMMRSYDTSLIPVPTNESLKDEPGELELSSDKLKQWVNDNTAFNDI